MVVQYFHVKKKNAPEGMGIVIRLQEGKLETFVGETQPANFGCSTDKKGQLIVQRDYFFYPVEEKEALRLKESFEHWRSPQSYE